MPTTIEDRLVVGDASVVVDLYRQHGAFIHTISQKLVGAAADRLTQQVFTEAWRDRLDFDPSLGTVRNWLVRRARMRVTERSEEVEMAVDRLVVADSLRRMDELRRQVVLAGIDEADADALARQLDQPVATIRGNLRRGSDQLKTDLVDSRPQGDIGGLVEIMAAGPPDLELVLPPEVVWQAIAAELDLDTGAVTTDDFHTVDEWSADDDGSGDSDSTETDTPDTTGEADHAEHDSGVSEEPPAEAETEANDDIDGGDDQGEDDEGEDEDEEPSVERLRREAEATDLDRPSSRVSPAVIALILVVVVVLLLALILAL